MQTIEGCIRGRVAWVTRKMDAHVMVDPYPVKRMNKPSRQNETSTYSAYSALYKRVLLVEYIHG